MPIDYSRYPPNWNDIAKQVKDRDEWTCQHCGAKHDDIVPASVPANQLALPGLNPAPARTKRIIVTVAHLDRDETNWNVSLDRLLTLCAACHLEYDREDNVRRRANGKNYRDNQKTFNL